MTSNTGAWKIVTFGTDLDHRFFTAARSTGSGINELFSIDTKGDVNVAGTLRASSLSGSGANLTSLSPANISAGTFGNAVTFASAPTFSGTGAPFQVSSTTKVANLNADHLDGVSAEQLARVDAPNRFSAAQTFDTAPTFSNASGAPFQVSSSTKVENLNADHLDGMSGEQLARVDAPNRFNAAQTFDTATVFNSAPGTPPFAVISSTRVDNLNADHLDGLSSENLVRLDISNTFTQAQTFRAPFTVENAGGTQSHFWVDDAGQVHWTGTAQGNVSGVAAQCGNANAGTTPSVASLTVLKIEGYTTPENITDLANGVDGQSVVLIAGNNAAPPVVLDDNGRSGGNFRLRGSMNWQPLPNWTLTLVRCNGVWYETARSEN